MTITRGELLRSVAVGAGSALTGAVAFGSATNDEAAGNEGASGRDLDQMTDQLSKDTFSKHIGSKFRIFDKTSPTVIEAELVEVNAQGTAVEFEQFSLLLVGPSEPRLNQQTFGIEHKEMGSFDLFLVPVAADEEGASYEAVFNRTRA